MSRAFKHFLLSGALMLTVFGEWLFWSFATASSYLKTKLDNLKAGDE